MNRHIGIEEYGMETSLSAGTLCGRRMKWSKLNLKSLIERFKSWNSTAEVR